MSVIIPTRDRPTLLVRAIDSALGQTFRDLEVVVVLDGPQPESRQALQRVADPRVRACELLEPSGLATALNAGVREARGSWVALLDDDDVWLPGKLAVQLETARRSRLRHPIVATRVIARCETGDRVWPRRPIRAGEPLPDYLFVRRTPFGGEGLVLPSAMVFQRDLAASHPFRSGLRTHVDVDWLLRVAAVPGVGVEFVPTAEPQVVWNIDQDRARISTARGWRESLAWIREVRGLVSPSAYAAFVLTWVPVNARRDRQWRAFGALLSEAVSAGRPSINDLVTYAGIWLLPPRATRLAAQLYAGLHRSLARGAKG